jgi:hypothetical protein
MPPLPGHSFKSDRHPIPIIVIRIAPKEVWFQDEMRVGQKNKLTYRWARKGSRPRAAHDQRTQSTYLFGAVCPERRVGSDGNQAELGGGVGSDGNQGSTPCKATLPAAP